jgi:iron complex outermembrane recepter protein
MARGNASLCLQRMCVWAGVLAALGVQASQPPATDARRQLIDLSLEELANTEITSVSRRPQRLADAAASVYVITADDIRRSGATSLAEALRLAPNLQVARVDSNQYAISARGFNGTVANKLLVLLDGRSLYTPLYSGVFWDVQDTLLEDIDHIEVISGPGATLWGANAVNGVISITTRDSRGSTGTLAGGFAATHERGIGARQGWDSGDDALRVYAKSMQRDSSHLAGSGAQTGDAWRLSQAGLRTDRLLSGDLVTLQGDLYDGSADQPGQPRRTLRGANLLGRWTHDLSSTSGLHVQAYFDHTERDYPQTFGERRNTWDLELQHRFVPAARHDLVWGADWRVSRDQVENSAALMFLPPSRRLQQYGLFVQDSWQWRPDELELTAGLRVDRGGYRDVDWQPNLRLAWRMSPTHLWWASLARAARQPSRIDRDLYSPRALLGGPDFHSEIANVGELGYRGSVRENLTLSATAFYADYRRLRSFEPTGSAPLPVEIANRVAGRNRGLEAWADWLPAKGLRVHAGGLWQKVSFHVVSGPPDRFISATGDDPRSQAQLRVSADPAPHWQLDGTLRRVGALPDPAVPAYTGLDLRVAWRPDAHWELALAGRDLLDAWHCEFGAAATCRQVGRSLMVSLTWTQ